MGEEFGEILGLYESLLEVLCEWLGERLCVRLGSRKLESLAASHTFSLEWCACAAWN